MISRPTTTAPIAAQLRCFPPADPNGRTRRLGLTKRFYDRFMPAISARDVTLRPRGLDGALDFLAVCAEPVDRGPRYP